MSGTVIQDTFKAWIDAMPGAGNRLIVTGEIMFNTSGWKASLQEAVPPGINPAILILDLLEAAPSGIVLEVITKEAVRFEKPDAAEIKQVTIRHRSGDFTIGVSVAH